MRFSANENFPGAAVAALRTAGHDVSWIRIDSPGATDGEVLASAVAEQRALLTFDKDFGELVYRRGLPAPCGILFFRIATTSPEYIADRVLGAVASRSDWAGVFAVVDDDQIRIRRLPGWGPSGP